MTATVSTLEHLAAFEFLSRSLVLHAWPEFEIQPVCRICNISLSLPASLLLFAGYSLIWTDMM